ncbi:hypothetical protein [Mycobacterium sp. IDR2000157661]|uniref:hypothetical protein n=1 Tax=Mycobacterium sp. IDR2000157661 TaxID=2867005 RepID=UPI001EE9C253|nr:hypothetical protein [Mycobacterium sp. IDR2000157661]ULE32867.1 hypothetical protein K3G64_22785 [Mycobacterium sp. IDR2000157661]
MTPTRADRMLIEAAMPRFDAVITEHTVVGADVHTTFAAARSLDLLTVRTPLVLASMWLRNVPVRLLGAPPPPARQLILSEAGTMPGWLVLGERADREIAFGAVGKFWQPVIEWRDVPRDEFAGFAEPGWGKIAANLSTIPYGEGSTLLSYECRTVTTDPGSRKRFQRYWWLIRPFVGHIMRATRQKVRSDAQAVSRPRSR